MLAQSSLPIESVSPLQILYFTTGDKVVEVTCINFPYIFLKNLCEEEGESLTFVHGCAFGSTVHECQE